LVGRIGLAGDWPSSPLFDNGIMPSRAPRIQYHRLRPGANDDSFENALQNPSGAALLKPVE